MRRRPPANPRPHAPPGSESPFGWSATSEGGCALLHECSCALGEVLRRGEPLLCFDLALERLLERWLGRLVDDALRERHSHRRRGEQLVAELLGRVVELVGGSDSIREA